MYQILFFKNILKFFKNLNKFIVINAVIPNDKISAQISWYTYFLRKVTSQRVNPTEPRERKLRYEVPPRIYPRGMCSTTNVL